MVKFKKVFNKLNSILVLICFFFLSSMELYPFSEDLLRAPVGQKDTYKRALQTRRHFFRHTIPGTAGALVLAAVGAPATLATPGKAYVFGKEMILPAYLSNETNIEKIVYLTNKIVNKNYENMALLLFDFEKICNSLTSIDKEAFLILRDNVIPALKSALFKHTSDEVSGLAAAALIAIGSSKFVTEELLLKIFEDLSKDFGKLKPKAIYDDLRGADRDFKIKWKTTAILLKIADRLPGTHPYHRLMFNFQGFIRRVDLMSRNFDFNLFVRIYSNKDFMASTNNLPLAVQFSVARAIDIILKIFDKDITNQAVSKILPFINAAVRDSKEKVLLDPDTCLIIFHNEAERHNPAGIIKLAKDVGVMDIKSPSGAYKKFLIDTMIRNAPIGTTIWFKGEGTKDGKSFIGKEGEIASCMDYQEIARAMMVFAKRHNNSFEGLVLVLDFCYAADFAYNLVTYLKPRLDKGQIKDMPLIISASDIDSRSFNTNLSYKVGINNVKPLWLSKRYDMQKITFRDVLDSVNNGIAFESFTYFFPLSKIQFEELRKALGAGMGYNTLKESTAILLSCL